MNRPGKRVHIDPPEHEPWLFVSMPDQTLRLMEGDVVRATFIVSTARKGPGELNGSYQTPRGWHQIRARIGAGLPEGAVFRGRRPTGEIYSDDLRRQFPDRLWILTRILWLSGLEPGFNRLGAVDTMRRFIYIHGCPDSNKLGVPGSIGCIEMRNKDLVELFDLVPPHTRVLISDD